MGNIKDLKGMRFGRLTVLELVGKDKSNRALWKCLCDCGKEKIVTSGNLKSGSVKSCGCLAKETARQQGKSRIEDITGKRFGRLIVLEMVPQKKRGETLWLCQCDCGEKTVTSLDRLKRGSTKSCGCLHRDIARERGKASIKHGKCNTRLFRVWTNMKTRCFNKNNNNYKRWGARGITVCKEWENDFSAFYQWALENGYSDGLSIDRIDNNKGYYPENCRWATPKEQANNTRKNRIIEYKGESHTLTEWARIYGLNIATLFYRLKRMDIGEALKNDIAYG